MCTQARDKVTKKSNRMQRRGFHAGPNLKPQEPSEQRTNTNDSDNTQKPFVSICTVTYNRPSVLKLLEKRILDQTYPRDRMEWVLIDDSPSDIPDFKPSPNSGLKVTYQRLPEKLTLGKKRNVSNSFCRGDIIVYMDDDDYYPPTRVEHAVQRLTTSTCLAAGSTILPILFVPENELWVSGPFNKNHATANTFAFKRELLKLTRFEDEATQAEERRFLKDYSIEMVQLEPKHTIVCIGHDRNTYEKRKLIQGGKNPRFRRIKELNQGQAALLQQISQAYLKTTSNSSAPRSSQEASAPRQTNSQDVHFKIILLADLGKDCIEKCIHSIKQQHHDKFNVLIVANGDNKDADKKLIEAIRSDPRFQLQTSGARNNSYLSSLLQGIRILKPVAHDILMILDGDSALYGTDSLEIIAHTYREKQCLFTYGGLARSSDGQTISAPLDTRIAMRNGSRQAGWLAPQLRTFKAGLLEFVNPQDLHDSEGNLLTDHGKTILLQALFEISSHRSEYIATPLLICNVTAENSTDEWQPQTASSWSSHPYAPAPFITLNTPSSHTASSNTSDKRHQSILWANTNDTPKVSAIIPTHNRPQHLIKAIQFFQAQTWPNKDLYILDDSPEICRAAVLAAANDSRIHYHHQTKKDSIGSMRKRLCEVATGEIIAHFDDDDYYAPHYLEAMIQGILWSNQDFVKLRSWWSIHKPTKTYGYCNTSQLDKTRFYKFSAEGVKPYPDLFDRDQLHSILYGYGFSYVYKKEVLQQACHPESINHGEDLIFANQCLEAGVKIGLLDDLGGIAAHVIHGSNTSTCFAQHIIRNPSVLQFTTMNQIASD